jgi:D-alanyl-D-alanine carboxypeptidase
VPLFVKPAARFLAVAVAAAALFPQACSAASEALLLVEADSGKVLYAENATPP